MESKKRSNRINLADMFDDGLVGVFCFLPCKTLFRVIPCVSRQFYRVLNTQIPESHWKKLYFNSFGFETNPNPPEDFSSYKSICLEKYKEFFLSRRFCSKDKMRSRIRTVSKVVDKKVINHEAYSEDYLPEKDTLRKSTISLRIYSPKQSWEEITIEDLCRIRGDLREPDLFQGTLKVIGKDGLMFQIEYEEGQVFLNERDCANIVNHYLGRPENYDPTKQEEEQEGKEKAKLKKEEEEEEEEEEEDDDDDEDGKGKFEWMKTFFKIIRMGITFKHVEPLIREFELSPNDGIFVPDDEDFHEVFPLLEADEVDIEEIAELASAHPTNVDVDPDDQGYEMAEREGSDEEEMNEEDRSFIDDGEDDDDDNAFFAQGADNEGGGGIIILDDDDDDDNEEEDDEEVEVFAINNQQGPVVIDIDIDDDDDDDDDDVTIVQ